MSVKYGIDSASWERTTTCRLDASLQGLLSGCNCRGCGYRKSFGVYSELSSYARSKIGVNMFLASESRME